jgi:hypothetical protein
MGMSGISKSRVRQLCGEIDHKVKAFLARPIEGDPAPQILELLITVVSMAMPIARRG